MSKDIDMMVSAEQEKKSNLAEWWHPETGRVKPEILDRRRKVAICWNRLGMSCAQTATNLGCSANTVSKDRHWLLQCWQKAVEADIVEIVSRELHKLEEQEAELWTAWEASKRDIESTVTEHHTDADGQRVGGDHIKRTVTGRLPDPKFMDLILKCQERRAKLLGLDKAVTFEGAVFSFSTFVSGAYEAAVALDDRRRMKDVTPPTELPESHQ